MTRVQTPPASYCLRSSESSFLTIINNHRASKGLVQLRTSQILGAAAKDKALDFIQGKPGVYGPYFGHTSPDGVTAEQNKINHGYPTASPGWGEIILWGEETAQQAFNVWFNSSEHRPSIEDSRFREIGIAGPYGVRYQDNYWGVWVVEFGNASTTAAGACGTTPPPTPGTFAVNDKIKVADGPLNVRSGAGTSFGVVTSLATNTQMCVTGGPTTAEGYTWYKIETGSTQGWVVGQFCSLVQAQGCGGTTPPPTPGTFAVNDKIKVADGPLNVRSGAGTSFGVVTSLATNTQMCVTGGPTNANGYTWYKIQAGSTQGWVVGQFCSLVQAQGCGGTTPPPTPTYTHKVTGSALNLRTCASTSCGVITALPVGTRLYILSGPQNAEGYTWYKIQPEGYTAGWSVNGFDPI